MVLQDRPECGFRLGGAAEAQRETRDPQLRLDVGGVGLDDALEEGDGFGGPTCAGQLFGVGQVGRRSLQRGHHHDRGAEWERHSGREQHDAYLAYGGNGSTPQVPCRGGITVCLCRAHHIR